MPELNAMDIEQLKREIMESLSAQIASQEQSLVSLIYNGFNDRRNTGEDLSELSDVDRGLLAEFEKKEKEERMDAPLPQEHPFEAVVDMDATPMKLYVRHGAFIWWDETGAQQFTGTDGSGSEAAFSAAISMLSPDSWDLTGALDIYARLVKSTGVASLSNAALVDDPDNYSVLVASVSAAGAVQQFIHDHIFIGGGDQPYPFQVEMRTEGSLTEWRIRGGKINIIDGDRTHYEIEVGTPIEFSAWVGVTEFAPYLICIALTCSDYNPTNWTAQIILVLQDAWPLDSAGKKHILVASDDAALGALEPPILTQHWRGGNLNLDCAIFGDAPPDPAAVAAKGESLRYARDDHAHRAPTLELIRPALTNSDLIPAIDSTDEGTGRHLLIGGTVGVTSRRWKTILATAYDSIILRQLVEANPSEIKVETVIVIKTVSNIDIDGQNITIDGTGRITLTVEDGPSLDLYEDATLTIPSNHEFRILGLPTTDPAADHPGVAGIVWNDSGTLKIT